MTELKINYYHISNSGFRMATSNNLQMFKVYTFS